MGTAGGQTQTCFCNGQDTEKSITPSYTLPSTNCKNVYGNCEKRAWECSKNSSGTDDKESSFLRPDQYSREGKIVRELELQKKAILSWLHFEQIDPESVTWYEDTLIDWKPTKSGSKPSRAVLAGMVTVVAIWKLGRLSRSIRDGVAVLSDWSNRGVRIASVAQQVDLQGQESREGQILAAFRELEVQAREERRLVNIAIAKKKEAEKQRRLEYIRQQKEAVWELSSNSLSVTEIAEKLGISVDTVSNTLIIHD